MNKNRRSTFGNTAFLSLKQMSRQTKKKKGVTFDNILINKREMVKTYPEGRKCKYCTTILSSYTKEKRCSNCQSKYTIKRLVRDDYEKRAR